LHNSECKLKIVANKIFKEFVKSTIVKLEKEILHDGLVKSNKLFGRY